MILAAGLTPAWQQILVFDRFQPGEVNRAREAHWCASGKALNVGRAVHALGAAGRTLSMAGGPAGTEIEGEFAADGIDARWIDAGTPTRVCTTILDQTTGDTTELVEESRPPSDAALAQFIEAYTAEVRHADIVVLSGSLPPGVSVDFYRRLLEVTPCRAILDIRGPELFEALACKPFLVKPNREELGRTLGRELSGDEEVTEAIHDVIQRGAEWVVITDGSQPVVIGSAKGIFRASPPAVDVVNPIGCGDSMAAGIAVALAEGKLPLDAVRFGMAAAADNAAQLLPAKLERGQVEAIAKRIARSPG